MTPSELITAFETLADAPDGIKRLRALVLHLAVRGKLVPQDPQEESAERFLATLAIGRTSKLNGHPQQLWEVPRGWKWVYFGGTHINRDGERVPLSREERSTRQGPYDYYGASGVIDSIDAYLFEKPLLLVGEDGANLVLRSTPIAYMARGRYWVNNHAHVLDSPDENSLRYLAIFLNCIDLRPHLTGTAQPKLNQANMNSIPCPFPPLAEQRRIVARVEELMGLLDRLEAAHTTRDQLRRAARDVVFETLRNAQSPEEVKGGWARISCEMETLFAAPDDVAALRQAILLLAVTGQMSEAEGIPVFLNDVVDPERPVSYGVLVPGDDIPGGVSLVRVADLHPTDPPVQPEKRISPEIAAAYGRVRLRGDELLLGVVGSIGKVGVARAEWAGAVVARAVVRMGIKTGVSRDYIRLVLQSPIAQNYFGEVTRTLAQPTLNVSLIRQMPFELPPFEEQFRIVGKVNTLMALCDQLAEKLGVARDLQSKFAAAAVHHLDV